jgi:hypothetical protein
MKKIILSLLVTSALFTACKKDDDNGGGTTTNQWKIGPNTYTASTGATLQGDALANVASTASTGSSFTVTFNTVPTTGGTYKIVGGVPSAADEVLITAGTGSLTSLSYYETSDNVSNPTANVTVENGKISVTVPSVWAKNITESDSLQISGNLTQK